jgi:glucosamine--fructose-6-phosphate aminotransferase (isomerizing)
MAEEDSVAQTRSFTSMYLLMQAVACLVAGQPGLLTQLGRTAGVFSPLVEEYQVLIKGLAENNKFERMVYLGSGLNYGLACEGMLKMKEMSLTPSEAFHFMEFRHGPKSVVSPGTLIVGLVNEAAKTQESQVLAEMRLLGATVLAISETENGSAADYLIALRSGVDYLASRVLTLPILQLLAYYRAVDKGLNPDRPTNLDAVVRLN